MVKLLDISVSRPALKAVPKTYGVKRHFDDGTVHVDFANGISVRRKPSVCLGCGCKHIHHGVNAESAKRLSSGLCDRCFDQEKIDRGLALIALKSGRRQTPAERRYIALVLATPLWRDRGEIGKIYEEAKRLSIETGIKHQVDHIYPIQSKFACGLHVHHNLQILKKSQNLSKKNKFPLFDSPALKL
jgi:hypothetical protein